MQLDGSAAPSSGIWLSSPQLPAQHPASVFPASSHSLQRVTDVGVYAQRQQQQQQHGSSALSQWSRGHFSAGKCLVHAFEEFISSWPAQISDLHTISAP